MTLHLTKVHGLVALIWFFAFASGFSETIVLQLRNGDRLTGTLLSENTNQIVIGTTWAKELAVPVSEISRREKISIPSEIVKTTNAIPASSGVKTNAPAAAKNKPPILRPKSWHGKIDIGMDLGFSEKKRQLYYGSAKVVYAPEVLPDEIKTFASRFKNTFDYQATYGRNDGILSANKMDGISKTDFEIRRKVFVYNLLAVGYDEVRTVDFQYEVGPGIGYHTINRSNLVLNTEFGFNYQVQNFQNNVQNERFFLRFAEDFSWKISQKLTLDEKLELMPSVDNFRSFRFRFESNLRYALWENISLTLSVLDLYDTKPAPGIGKNDLQVRSMIGVNF